MCLAVEMVQHAKTRRLCNRPTRVLCSGGDGQKQTKQLPDRFFDRGHVGKRLSCRRCRGGFYFAACTCCLQEACLVLHYEPGRGAGPHVYLMVILYTSVLQF